LSLKRYLVPSEYSATDSWRLVEWCKSLGADEFTIDCHSIDTSAADILWERFQKTMRPRAVGKSVRERMSGRTADDLRRPTDLWSLDDSALDFLKSVLPEGVFQYDPRGGAWFEDPIFYRGGELMLGVLSHEAFAVLRVTDRESGELAAAGFTSHDSLPRIS